MQETKFHTAGNAHIICQQPPAQIKYWILRILLHGYTLLVSTAPPPLSNWMFPKKKSNLTVFIILQINVVINENCNPQHYWNYTTKVSDPEMNNWSRLCVLGGAPDRYAGMVC